MADAPQTENKKKSILDKSIEHAIAAADDDESQVQAEVDQLNDKKIKINKIMYTLIADYNGGFNSQRLAIRYNDVLSKYDYIVGDWGYGQLRLRGFYEDDRTESKLDQKIDTLQDYILEYCNFGCAYFVLEKDNKPQMKKNIIHKKSKRHNNNKNKFTRKYRRRKIDDKKELPKHIKSKKIKGGNNKKSQKRNFTVRNLNK